MLLDALPPSSACARVYTGIPEGWTDATYLLANVVDLLDSLVYVTLKAAGAKGVAKPTPVKRPDTDTGHTEAEPRQQTSVEELAALLAGSGRVRGPGSDGV